MFHFTEYFVRKSIRNGISLLIITASLIYLSSGSLVHNFSILLFLIAAICWIYFGMKFKKSLDSVDEPTNHELESSFVRLSKSVDSFLSAALLFAIILSMALPSGNAIYFLVAVIAFLFILRIYHIVIISNYLKKEVRN